MNAIKLRKQMSDGLVVQYFTVRELKFSDATVEVVIGAWEKINNAAKNLYPEVSLSVTIPYEDMSAVTDGLLERICAMDDWQGGVLVDLAEEVRIANKAKPSPEQAPQVI